MFSRLIILPLSLLASTACAIWPVPRSLETGDEVLYIDQTVKITYNGGNLPYTYEYSPRPGSDYDSKDIVQGAVSRAFTSIFQRNLVPWVLHDRGVDFEPDVYASDKVWVKSIEITQADADDEENPYVLLTEEWDESYTLSISEDGVAEIEAKTSIGIIRALETFAQLFWKHSSGTFWYTNLAPVAIEDSPKYPHRGILFDTSRHFFPVKDILRTLDAMSWAKLNKFHVHVTDSQSWPLEIPSMPDLAEKGRYAKGLTYTPEDVKNIHEYAMHRGIQVIVEIDMPGHTGSIALSYPELIVAYNEQPYYWWCAQPPCGAFKLNDSRVDDFLDDLFDDFLPRVKPYTAYFHTGGDELNANDSMLDEGIRSNSSEVLQPLLQKFMDRNHKRVRDQGLVPMVWEEIPLDWNVTLGKDVVVQSWLGGDSIQELTSMGHKVIDSNYNFWYLDCGRGQWLNFDNGAAYQQFYPFNDWCGPTKSWQLIYSHDPADGLNETEAKLVLGGEVAAWSETIDPTNLDMILWPRAGAAAEVLWSGRTDAGGQNRSQYDAAPRLSEFRERMVARGVGAAPFYQQWCSMVSPGECGYEV